MNRSLHLLLSTLLASGLATACTDAPANTRSTQAAETWQRTAVIGDSTANGLMLGKVTDAAVAGSRVLILDGMQATAWAVSEAGMPVPIGRAGDGPGEFRIPVALATLGRDTVVVADLRHRSLQYFALQDTAADWLGEVSLRFPPADLCAMGSSIYVLGPWQGHAVHQVDPAAGVVRSMANRTPPGQERPETAEEALRWHERSSGYLACVPGWGLVQVTERLGEAAMYDTAGAVLWETTLPGFAPPVRTIRGDHVRMDIDPEFGYADRVAAVAWLGGDRLAVTVTRSYGRESGTPEEDYRLTVNVADGTGETAGGWPLRSLAVSGDSALAYEEVPYPHLVLWTRQ